MQISNAKLSDLQALFDKRYGARGWEDWEPESIMLDFESTDSLLYEKIFVLKCLNKALNSVVSLPEFLLWTVSVCNNEPPQFETLNIPTSLELAWAIEEIKKIGNLTGQPFKPTSELSDVVGYMLNLEGFSTPVYPFEFVSEKFFKSGQTPEDIKMKAQAIGSYIKHMQKANEIAE